ncbi:bifunctional diaminohydroxyphosphoribosylaminopyrimidine deaminase/5-amino-6-(5-phosphoribosylamino)uracil reductase RibD [Flavobacterium sp.]|uniref:bifunctional diaminohydroxyphosphoribosylaminopyrimidine deaminase/5-amino-6-(5-phosphoribosylamino)uracil reductase RibD n=1 Tax=Flavobacterium sp. TaxID=239 RepID=UPI0039E4AC6F
MNHQLYMQRCIELAQNGLGTTYPNPMVGSVIVHNGKIIGEGWHQKSGEPHAEVNAVNAVKDKSLLKEATIYVSLEPCSHFGKTPPCCDLIIAHQIPNVVVGCVDPNEKVAGSGIAKLKASGKNVIVGVLEKECRELNKRFFTFHNRKRPYIILKWAESADGLIAPKKRYEQKPVWISGIYARQLVHKWRSKEQAILVGTQTVVDDNPKLDVRDWSGPNPVRLVIDKSNRISKESYIFDSQVRTIVFGENDFDWKKDNVDWIAIDFAAQKVTGLNPVEVTAIPQQIADVLYRQNLQSVIVEGGRQTLQSFIDSGLWDEARVFKSPIVLGDGIPAPDFNANWQHRQTIGSDELLIFRQYD